MIESDKSNKLNECCEVSVIFMRLCYSDSGITGRLCNVTNPTTSLLTSTTKLLMTHHQSLTSRSTSQFTSQRVAFGTRRRHNGKERVVVRHAVQTASLLSVSATIWRRSDQVSISPPTSLTSLSSRWLFNLFCLLDPSLIFKWKQRVKVL